MFYIMGILGAIVFFGVFNQTLDEMEFNRKNNGDKCACSSHPALCEYCNRKIRDEGV